MNRWRRKTATFVHRAYRSSWRWFRHQRGAIVSGTVAGILAGIALALTNAAIDYWQRPQATFVATVNSSSEIQLAVFNVGGTPLREGYFHIAIPEEYGPSTGQ